MPPNTVVPGDTTFLLKRRCYQFQCTCPCGGRWSCDHRNPTNTCKEKQEQQRRLSASARSQIKSSIRGTDQQSRKDLTAYRSTVARQNEAQRGSSFAETDIRSSSQSRSGSNRNSNRNTQNSRQSSVSLEYEQPSRECVLNDDLKIKANEEFSFKRGCLHYQQCVCHSTGKWQCAKQENICAPNPNIGNNR